MPRNAEGLLDDIGTAEPEPAVSEPAPSESAEPAEVTTVTADDAGDKSEAKPKPDKTDPANSPARPDGYVPKQAIERIQGELQAERQARERAEANFQKFLDRWHADNAQPEREEPVVEDPGPEPDAADDPVGWIAWRQRHDRFERHQQETQRSQQTEAQRRESQYAEWTVQGIEEFKQTAPDYDAARDFFWQQRGNELMALGYSHQQASQRIANDERDIRDTAINRRQNPAEVFYNIARARGYQAKVATEKSEADAAGEMKRDPTTGKFVSPDAEKAARIKESQERNGSLSSAPGTPVEKMSAKELAKMSEEDMWRTFDKMKGRKGSKQFDHDMGFR